MRSSRACAAYLQPWLFNVASRASEGPGENAGLLRVCLENACSDFFSVAHFFSLRYARLRMDSQAPHCPLGSQAFLHDHDMPCPFDP